MSSDLSLRWRNPKVIPLLAVDGLTKNFRRGSEQIRALDSVTLALRSGEIVGLLGPNGSGKSTFVKVVSGLCESDAGLVLWKGQKDPGHKIAHQMGLLLEGRGAVNERLSTLENAEYFCALREKVFNAKFFERLVQLLEIPDANCPIRQFSTGLKLRASLLATLVHEPAIVLLDEPTLGLDALGVAQLEAIIHESSARGTCCLVSSHDLHFIERLCPRIICLNRGQVIFDGSRQHFTRLDHLYKVIVRPGSTADDLRKLSWPWIENKNNQMELHIHNNSELSNLVEDLQPHIAAVELIEILVVGLREKYLYMLAETSAPMGHKP